VFKKERKGGFLEREEKSDTVQTNAVFSLCGPMGKDGMAASL
jgi:hypothetical protein